MPIVPRFVKPLVDVYDELVDTAGDLTDAAAKIAPSAVGQILCTAGGLGSLLGNPIGKKFGPPGSSDRLIDDLSGVLKRACPLPPPLPPVGTLPYEGGQCPGVLYVVDMVFRRVNIFNCNQFETEFSQGNVVGPVGSFTLDVPREVNCDKSLSGFAQVRLNGATFFATPGNTALLSIKSINVRRSDGQPDDCGNPPLLPPPPPGPIPSIPDSPGIPSGPNGDGPDYIFRPTVGPIFIGPNGDVNVPVVVNVGGPAIDAPITIPVTVNLPSFSPTVNIGGGGGKSPPGTPPDPVEPPTPPEPVCCRPKPLPGEEVEGEEDEPVESEDPPPSSRLVGVVVRATIDRSAISATEIGQGGGNENLFVPRLGLLYFEIETETESGAPQESFTSDYPVKRLVQFIPAPAEVKTKGFKAYPERGVTFKITPSYVRINEAEQASKTESN